MLKLADVFQGWKSNGTLHQNVPWWGFVDEHAFLTKAGDVGVIFKVPGIDFETLSADQLSTYTKRFRSALKLLDPNWRFYQLLFRHNRPEIASREYPNPVVNAALSARRRHFEVRAHRLYRLDTYYVLMTPSARPKALRFMEKLEGAFKTDTQAAQIEREIDQALMHLHERATNFLAQLNDFLPAELLGKEDAYLVMRRLLNPDPRKAAAPGLKYDTHLDVYAADSTLEANRNHLRLDDYFVRIVTLKDPTAETWPLVLKRLYEIQANYHVVIEWHAIPLDDARSIISKARRHHHIQKTSMMAHMQDSPNANDVLVDPSKGALVGSLNQALTDMELNGRYFGELTLSVVIYDLDREIVDRAVAEIYKLFASSDGAVYEESYNLLNAFYATLPGNTHFNLRKLLVTDANLADQSFVFSLSHGEPVCRHLNDEALATFETQHNTLYHLNLHVNDVGHTLILGKTGSGKSFLLNFLATNAQKYDGYTFFFDLGGSFRGITKLFGGTYLKVGVDGQNPDDPLAPPPVQINPFALDPTPENLEFLATFLRVLLEGHDYKLTVADERETVAMIHVIYNLEPENRRLLNYSNLLPRHLADRLHKWVHGSPVGQYAFMFDNTEDTLELSKFLCVDFEGLDRYPLLVEPLLFYLLHRANAVIYDPALASKLKLFFIDEAWRFFSHPAIAQYIVEALKTWRKKNAAMILSTQSVDDLRKTPILDVLVESCGTKIFLANDALNEELYQDTLKLTPSTTALIKTLRPKAQVLVSRPDHTKILTLSVDPRSYWLYTNDPNDNARRDAAMAEHGFEGGLAYLEGVKR